MSSSSAFKWALAFVLLLSFVWKIAVPAQEDPTERLVEFLTRNHFVVTSADIKTIQAQSGSCRLQVVNLDSDGSDREVVRELTNGADRAFVVFRGRVYDQQPVFWTAIDHLWSERLRELGLVRPPAPPIAVIANGPCDADGLPWRELNAAS